MLEKIVTGQSSSIRAEGRAKMKVEEGQESKMNERVNQARQQRRRLVFLLGVLFGYHVQVRPSTLVTSELRSGAT